MANGSSLGRPATRATLAGLALALTALPTRSQTLLAHVETRDASLVGELIALESTQGVQLQGADPIQLPIGEVLNLRFEQPSSRAQASPPPKGEVTLIDGARLNYRASELADNNLLLQLTDGSQCQLRLAGVQRWWLDSKEPLPEAQRRVADVLWVKSRQGDGVTPVEGVVLEVSEQGVSFAFSGEDAAEPVVAPWPRLAGIEFFHEPSPPSPPSCLVRLSPAGQLVAEELRLEADRIVWKSRYGRGDLGLDGVVLIDLSAGRVASVSELKLLAQSWRPYHEVGGSSAGFALDSSFDGAKIRLLEPDPRAPSAWPGVSLERVYETGVALKSRGEARFALPAGAARLKGRIGLDPSCVRSGSAEVTILANERVLWSDVIDGSTLPVELNASLEGAATLTLRVDYGDNLDAGDYVHFADLRVIQ